MAEGKLIFTADAHIDSGWVGALCWLSFQGGQTKEEIRALAEETSSHSSVNRSACIGNLNVELIVLPH